MKVAIDGFNLALEKGTGVATYGRNLSYCLRDLGHEVHALYGKAGAPGKAQLMREVAFFDTEVDGPLQRIRREIGAAIGAGVAYRARRAKEVILSGAVIYEQFLPT